MFRLLCLLLALLATPYLHPQSGEGNQQGLTASLSDQKGADSAYKVLFDKVLEGKITEETFTQLRLLYAKTTIYDPLDLNMRMKRFSDLSKEKNYQAIVDEGSKLIFEMIALGDYHFYMKTAYRSLGMDNYYKFHNMFHFQLLYSIMRSGDGASTASSFTVITVAEEYNVLAYQQAKWKTQEVMEEDGHWFDVFELESGKKMYFNIDLVHQYEEAMLKSR